MTLIVSALGELLCMNIETVYTSVLLGPSSGLWLRQTRLTRCVAARQVYQITLAAGVTDGQ